MENNIMSTSALKMEPEGNHSNVQHGGNTTVNKLNKLKPTIHSEGEVIQKNEECVLDSSNNICCSDLNESTEFSPKQLDILVKTDYCEVKSKQHEIFYDWKIKNEEVDLKNDDLITVEDNVSSVACGQEKPDSNKNHKCILCDFQTEREDNLKRHLLGHKKLKEVGSFSCDKFDNVTRPVHDIICSLKETPFCTLKDDDRRDVINEGRPTPPLNVLKDDHKHGKHYLRSFNIKWYNCHQWLCGSYFKQGLFCWPCLLLSRGSSSVWISQGYSDFKNLFRAIKTHEGSKEHMSNYLSLKRLETNYSTVRDASEIQSSLSSKLYNERVRENRKLLGYLIDATCVLAKQELSFRPHNEKSYSFNSGNFHETLNLIIKRIEDQEHLKKIGNGLCNTIQNDIILCISEYLTDIIRKEIQESLFFAVQVDDTTDIVEKSQCAISLRYVNKCGEIKERFLGFHDVSEDRTADAIHGLITSVLSPFNFKYKLVGQCYDGASVKVDSLNSLQKKVKDDVPTALFTHCSSHSLNLVLQNGSRNIKNCRIYFASVNSIPSFFQHSAKRTFILDSVVPKSISSETIWAPRSNIIQVLESEWNGLKTAFQKIIDDQSSASESINGAIGFLKLMHDLEFAFLTTVYKNIFDITDFLFDVLQKKSWDVSYCKNQVFSAQESINALRNELVFDNLFEKAKIKTVSNRNSDSQQPLPKRTKLSESVECEERASLRILFFEIIDNIVRQIDVRFADMSQILYFSLVDTSKFQKYRTVFPLKLINSLTSFYKNVFDKQKLTNELKIIYNDKQFEQLNIELMLKYLVNNDFSQIFSEVYKLCVLIATIPATNMSVERHQSCLKRIKTYSRNLMKNDRLSSLALISIERELFSSLQESEEFTENIIKKFSLLKDNRIDLIYRK